MKNLCIICLSGIAMSCALVKAPVKTVHFPYVQELVEQVQKNVARTPAAFEFTADPEISTRRVYFSGLYHQYLTLGQNLGKLPDLGSCPQFHHDKLETDALAVPQVSSLQKPSVDSQDRAYFPELVFTKEFSLGDYHLVIKSELDQLCEDGVSDNFFKFDNLVTHYANNKNFHLSPKAMSSVLKIPVFANFYLVNMLRGPAAVNSPSAAPTRFISMTNTGWFEKYVAEATHRRGSFLKNKMVKR
ncbi:MAG TPA: hypothetical protein VNJ01_02140 [Bacteriovoracaceae bacterium]|nr:hypothetical protein [Bacteriovoracaceae bacterium]